MNPWDFAAWAASFPLDELRRWWQPARERSRCETCHLINLGKTNCPDCGGWNMRFLHRGVLSKGVPTLQPLHILGPAASGKTVLANVLQDLSRKHGLPVLRIVDEHTEARPWSGEGTPDRQPPEDLVYREPGRKPHTIYVSNVWRLDPKADAVQFSMGSDSAKLLRDASHGNPAPAITELIEFIIEKIP